MAKVYKFEIVVDESGKVSLKHTCSNLLEFLGVLELTKAIGLKMFQRSLDETKGVETTIDPQEYLEQVKKNTKVVDVKGIIRTMQ